ncbi:hypothetical protein KX928_23295 [Roseobacter sp. YSTF-M11]|uniref:Uncharacterized protein n=1 Tax=Roseobacter insulae TaxID=2859783 RepID=A0A9X1G017_9RHOB|nr:hypothetical protein [Roseobacter insulae]MBW4710726.1 hypothetical protein [Roseobacter insulae]
MTIGVLPLSPHAAMAVFRDLDPWDLIEAQAVRGSQADHLSLFAEWYGARHAHVVSHVLTQGATQTPFAVLALAHTGQAGVAQAALLARDHGRYAKSLAQAGVIIRQRLPAVMAELGIHRIECRCLQRHPTAQRFLQLLGFHKETDMPGFGLSGNITFCQMAMVSPQSSKKDDPKCA